MCPIFPSLLPLPLVTLRLSTASILDTVLTDAQDATPLFSVESLENKTTVYMYDHRRGSDSQLRVSEVANIQWPLAGYGSKAKQSPIVSLLGDVQPASTFLKKSTFGGNRKFYIPGQTHPLRWKHVGEHYECTLCSHACTAHCAVATFEPAHTTSAARLAVYTSSVTNDPPTSEYQDVDMDMIVYLIVSCILLSAPHQQPQPGSPKATPGSPKASTISNTTCQPSPVSSMGNYKIDLLAPDEAFVPARSSSSPSSTSSGSLSLPASPITPANDLWSITHETFLPSSPNCASTVSRSSSLLVGRRQSTRHSHTSTPQSHAGPNSITPYHLPPAPVHSSPTQTRISPPALRLQVPSPMHSQQPSPRTPHMLLANNHNALLLDTTTYTEHISPYSIPPPPVEERPPAYNEIEWTVRVKQPRQMTLQAF